MRHGLVEQVERMLIAIAREGSADHGEEAFERAESVDDGWGLVAATHHAVGALGIARGHTVVFPLGFFEELFVCVGVALLQQVARALPTEDVVGGHAPGNAIVVAIAHEELEEQGRHIELPGFLAVGENGAEEAAHAGAAHELGLIGSLLVAVSRRENDALDAHGHDFIEELADVVGIGAIEEGGVGGDAETALHRFFDAFDGDVVTALAADGEVVMIAVAIEVNREGEVLGRREFVQPLFELERVGAEVDVLFARDEAVDDLDDLRMEQRLAAGDGDHGRAALIDGSEALLGRELFFENVGRILHLTASGAGQVAAEERLKHENKRILLVACELFLQDVGGNRPHL